MSKIMSRELKPHGRTNATTSKDEDAEREVELLIKSINKVVTVIQRFYGFAPISLSSHKQMPLERNGIIAEQNGGKDKRLH